MYIMSTCFVSNTIKWKTHLYYWKYNEDGEYII